MIIYMSDVVCITNRHLCDEDFEDRIRELSEAHPAFIVLREKDLTKEEYRTLAEKAISVCRQNGTKLVLHSFAEVALELDVDCLHLPLPVLRTLSLETRKRFSMLGASCHSVADALEAESLGCTYITAGHIFETDCKKDLPGRGLAFLREVVEAVSIPVYAIGGIHPSNCQSVRNTGAKGICVMSGCMQCADVKTYLEDFSDAVSK